MVSRNFFWHSWTLFKCSSRIYMAPLVLSPDRTALCNVVFLTVQQLMFPSLVVGLFVRYIKPVFRISFFKLVYEYSVFLWRFLLLLEAIWGSQRAVQVISKRGHSDFRVNFFATHVRSSPQCRISIKKFLIVESKEVEFDRLGSLYLQSSAILLYF